MPIIYNFDVADVSGQIRLCIYGPDGLDINEGDVLLLRGCFVKQFADFIYLNMSRSGKVIRIRSFTLLFSEMPNLSREFEIPEDYQPPRKLMNGNNKMHSGAPTSSRPPYTPYTRGQSNSSKYYSHQRSNRDRI
ncbi:SOSS complex subunit B1 [Entomophthora muscae]|uniref:SOSS complex subunit B1 n=1 Tax=Entomophthora muscae TaxID=34485 RepID=A0ACC2SYA6_9FUNG|nr:SOSS complex subunit B1 [Entomophthora muscae]